VTDPREPGEAPDERSEGRPDCVGRSEGDLRPHPRRPHPRRRAVLAGLAVAVLALDAVLLAWSEMAWLTLRVGVTGIPLPLAALVAALTTPVLVLGADAVRPGSRAPLVPLGAWTLTVLVAGLWSPAGAGVLPPDWRAVLLLGAGAVPGALAVSWRSARHRETARHG
jgi:MFS family permease